MSNLITNTIQTLKQKFKSKHGVALLVVNLVLLFVMPGLAVAMSLIWWFWETSKIKRTVKLLVTIILSSLGLMLTSVVAYGYYHDPEPTLTIHTPAPVSRTVSEKVRIQGEYNPDDFKVYLNDHQISTANGTFDVMVDIMPGENVLTIRVSNFRSIEKTLTVIRDQVETPSPMPSSTPTITPDPLMTLGEATQAANLRGFEATFSANPEAGLFVVTKIIDGDTVEINIGQKVRYIGIDTPETDECYYSQSSARNSELVLNKQVRLEKDVSEVDRYGRLLRYVYEGGTMVNEALVREGFAKASSYPPDIKYQDTFKQLQQEAQSREVGLWGIGCTCEDIEISRSCVSCNMAEIVQQQADCQEMTISKQDFQCSYLCETNSTTSTPTPVSKTCQYNCSSPDRDCQDFSNHSQAQSFFNCCGFSATNDPMRLDSAQGSGNGVACETLP